MAQLNTVTCDVCGTVKHKANHWFKATQGPGRFTVAQWDANYYSLSDSPEIHLCSESCASKAMSKAIGATGNLEKSGYNPADANR